MLTGRVLQTAGARCQNPTLGGGYMKKGRAASAANGVVSHPENLIIRGDLAKDESRQSGWL
jgi:hypothetical protein